MKKSECSIAVLWLQKRAVLTALGLVQAAVPMAELCTELCGCCEEQRGSKGGQQSWRLRVAQDGFSSSLPWAESKAEIYVSINVSRNVWSSSSYDKLFLRSFLMCIAIMPVNLLTLIFRLLFATVLT